MTSGKLAWVASAILYATSVAGQTGETVRTLSSDSPLPFQLTCDEFDDYQQPLDDSPSHSTYISDERVSLEVSEATVEGATIVPVPGLAIQGLRLWGLSLGNNTLLNCFDDDAVPFDVRFYSDQGQAPGDQIGPTVVVEAVRFDTGIQFFNPGLTIQRFDFFFIPPIDNQAGSISWISARRQLGDPDCIFHWMDETTPDFDDLAFWITSGSIGTDMTMCLDLEPIAVELESATIE